MDSREIEKRRLIFDDYSQKDEDGVEYWLARDIMKPLGYSRWENFYEAIKRAMISCETAKTPVECHFREVTKMVKSGVASKPVNDFELTRFACYLIAQNGDPRKDEIALFWESKWISRSDFLAECMAMVSALSEDINPSVMESVIGCMRMRSVEETLATNE